MTLNSAKLLSDLQDATKKARPGCPLCLLIQDTADRTTKQALTDAAAGTISRDKFAEILKAHETGIGKRTITRHRDEEHKP